MSGLSRCLAGVLNQKIWFVLGALSTSFTRAIPGLIQYSPSCHLQQGCRAEPKQFWIYGARSWNLGYRSTDI